MACSVGLAGVRAVFLNATATGLLIDPAAARDRLRTLLGHATSHGARRIVLLSSLGLDRRQHRFRSHTGCNAASS